MTFGVIGVWQIGMKHIGPQNESLSLTLWPTAPVGPASPAAPYKEKSHLSLNTIEIIYKILWKKSEKFER